MRRISDLAQAELVRNWIRRSLTNYGMTATELARRARVPQPTVTRFLSGATSQLQRSTISRLAKVSPIEIPSTLRDLVDAGDARVTEHDVNKTRHPTLDLPVWGVIPAGRTGEFRLNPLAVGTFPRPSHIPPTRKLAVFYAWDETMAPRWEMGEPVVIDLSRPPAPGTAALIKLTSPDDPNSEETHLFRRYEGRRDGLVKLSRLDGGEQISIEINRVLEVRRALDWKDLLE